jgi:preprotein translocase subunit SecE
MAMYGQRGGPKPAIETLAIPRKKAEVAEGRRRDGDAEKARRDEAHDDALELDDELEAGDDFADDVADDELDDVDDELDGDDERAAGSGRSGGTATKARPRSTVPAGRKATKGKTVSRMNIFARLANFFREVVAELRKVIWPTRKELLTYTAVVVVFVTIMVTVVGLLDVGFAQAVLWVFGTKDNAGK